MRSTPTRPALGHPCRRNHAFTLVELLVVIGIIALLISILLPTLGAARRSANQVKCASSLKQIGNAFKLYEIEFKGAWPIALWKSSDTTIPIAERERRWQDLISKYLHKSAAKGADQISQYRRSSVLWGCPSFDKVDEFNEANYGDRVRNGYGMQIYTMAPAIRSGTTAALPGNNAYIVMPGALFGTWQKASNWQRKGDTGSANRGLVADSSQHIIQALGPYSRSTSGFHMGSSTNVVPAGATTYVWVDAARHAKSNSNVDSVRKQTGINMLFCDMSVRPVTPADAFLATRGGGVGNPTPTATTAVVP